MTELISIFLSIMIIISSNSYSIEDLNSNEIEIDKAEIHREMSDIDEIKYEKIMAESIIKETEKKTTETIMDSKMIEWYNDFRPNLIKTDENINKDLLAKLLYLEAGSMSWEGQVFTCSAILNLCDYYRTELESIAYNQNIFSVAPYVKYSEALQYQYDVIDYVLSGNKISDIICFRTDKYHDFGENVCKIENVYFSKINKDIEQNKDK